MDSNQTTTTGVAAGPPPQKPQNQSSNQGRGSGSRGQGRDRGQGRGHGSRGQGRGSQQQGRGEGPVGIAPTTGIPYGHVPAYLPGSSSLVEELDKRILMVLRDGRHLIGVSSIGWEWPSDLSIYCNLMNRSSISRFCDRLISSATWF